MENKRQNNNQQSFDKSSNAASEQNKTTGTGANKSSEDIEPVLDEEDMKENHLKEEDLDKIVWDKPSQPDEELSKPEKDITA